jgi:hypothetical protein
MVMKGKRKQQRKREERELKGNGLYGGIGKVK